MSYSRKHPPYNIMLKRDIKNSEREFYGSVFPQEFAKVYSGKKYTMLFLAWRPKKKHGIFWPEYTLANSIGNTDRQILQRNFKCHVFTHNMSFGFSLWNMSVGIRLRNYPRDILLGNSSVIFHKEFP